MTPRSPNQPAIPKSQTRERLKVQDCPHSKGGQRYHRLVCGYVPRFSVKHKSQELLCKYMMYDFFFKLHSHSSLKAYIGIKFCDCPPCKDDFSTERAVICHWGTRIIG